MSPAYPFPFDDLPYPWLRDLPPVASDDTQPTPAIDSLSDCPTEPLAPLPDPIRDAPPAWVTDIARDITEAMALEGVSASMTTVEYLASMGTDDLDELDEVTFASVGTNGLVAVRSAWPAGTEVMVTVMKVGGR